MTIEDARTHMSQAEALTDPKQAAAHRLAALAYCFVGGHREALPSILPALASAPELPTLAELLGDPSFEPLRSFLDARSVDPEQLQRMLMSLVARGELATPASALERMLEPLVKAAASGQDVGALLEQLRDDLIAQHPDKPAEEIEAFIGQFRSKLATFTPQR